MMMMMMMREISKACFKDSKIIRLKNLPYEERLKIWGVALLEERRKR